MDRLRVLAIKTALNILDEENETPGSQPEQTLELAKQLLTIIEDGQLAEFQRGLAAGTENPY